MFMLSYNYRIERGRTALIIIIYKLFTNNKLTAVMVILLYSEINVYHYYYKISNLIFTLLI